MTEKNQRDPKNEQDQKTSDGFTGIRSEKPFPDFEPKKSEEKQVEQFEDVAENRKSGSLENHYLNGNIKP